MKSFINFIKRRFIGVKAGDCDSVNYFGLDIGRASIQELCMASWMLKEEGVNQHDTPETETIFKQYILTTGAFAAGFYNQEQLLDEQSRTIGPEIRAAYRIAMTLRGVRRG